MRERSRQSGGAQGDREKRLAEALRANLKLRKTQPRKRADAAGEAAEEPDRNGR